MRTLKSLASAVAALALAATAQALTTTWSDWQEIPGMDDHTGDARYTTTHPVISEIDGSFAVKGSLTLGSIKNSTTSVGLLLGVAVGTSSSYEVAHILLRGGGADGTGRIAFYQGNKGTGNNQMKTAVGDFTAQPDTAYTFLIEYDAATDSLSAYVNDTLLGTFEDVGFAGKPINEISMGIQTGGGINLNSVSEGYVYAKDEGISLTQVPEPTALALLAHGAAALALRPRHTATQTVAAR